MIPESTVLQELQTNSTLDYCTGLILHQQNNANKLQAIRALFVEFAVIAHSTYAMQTTEQPLLARNFALLHKSMASMIMPQLVKQGLLPAELPADVEMVKQRRRHWRVLAMAKFHTNMPLHKDVYRRFINAMEGIHDVTDRRAGHILPAIAPSQQFAMGLTDGQRA